MIGHEHGKLLYFSYNIFEPFDTMFSFVSSRLGGVSTGYCHSLNLSLSAGDDEAAVIKNRTLVCEAMGIELGSVTIGQLVHGTNIAVVTSSSRGKGATDRFSSIPATDGLITDVPELPLLTLVADCAVLSFFDPKRQVVALGHGGWRGTVGGIARKMVERMNGAFGCNPADIRVGISPSIGPCCYEVREDVIDAFHDAFPDQAQRFFVLQPDGSVHLDMWKAITWQLLDSGIQNEHIELSGICTACHTDLFYSHRAEKGRTGRFGAITTLRSTAK
jgi:YfiH family protein